MFPRRIDGLTVVALGLIAFMVLNVLQDRGALQTAQAAAEATATPLVVDLSAQIQTAGPGLGNDPQAGGGNTYLDKQLLDNGGIENTAAGLSPDDPRAFFPPYESYTVTQGLHGFSYGHAAVDISAGNGETILSPITGEVTAFYVDEWNNTTLVLENAQYKVILLHGLYTVSIGDRVQIGHPIGTESNQGNTYDAYGQYCGGRDCGYHTHLNVFDKTLGVNVDPLVLMGE